MSAIFWIASAAQLPHCQVYRLKPCASSSRNIEPQVAAGLIGGGKTSAGQAAFFNSGLVRYVDLLDTIHVVAASVIPATTFTGSVLAVAGQVGATGEEFMLPHARWCQRASDRCTKLGCAPSHFSKTIICEILSLPFFDGLQNETGDEFGLVASGVIGLRPASGRISHSVLAEICRGDQRVNFTDGDVVFFQALRVPSG